MPTNTRTLDYVRSYEEADKLYTKTPTPRTRSRGRYIWSDHQRPLGTNRQWHYRVERHDNGEYYDVCLYHTVMARYYKPTDEGRRVLLRGHGSTTSKQFMSNVLAVRDGVVLTTDGGEKVVVPLPSNTRIKDVGDNFDASLWLDNNNMLVTSMSEHTPMYRSVRTKHDRENRAQARKIFEPYVTLAVIDMHQWQNDYAADYYLSKPFSSVSLSFTTTNSIKAVASAHMQGEIPREEDVQGIINLRVAAFLPLLSKRARAEYRTTHHRVSIYCADLASPPSQQDVAKSMMRIIMKSLGLEARTGYEPLPQFMKAEDYPRSNVSPYGR